MSFYVYVLFLLTMKKIISSNKEIIFNVDETGGFYRMLYHTALTAKGGFYKEGKKKS